VRKAGLAQLLRAVAPGIALDGEIV